MSGPTVLFYVQHLWGVGHVYRASRIARALAESGMDVHVAWGGTNVPGFDAPGFKRHLLPPVRSQSAKFSQLVHADGREFTEADQEARCARLMDLYQQILPDILITEAFPFGRRQMRFELLPLLEFAANAPKRPLIVSSIRDIMQEGRSEKRVAESVDYVRRWFDLVLVHGDPAFVRIEETLQGVDQFSDKIRYTGLVTPQASQGQFRSDRISDVLVSVGGGAFGHALVQTAVEAMPLSRAFPRNWLLTAGSQISDRAFEELGTRIPPGMQLVRHIEDLADAMRNTGVSVSHAGYNTVADLLRAQRPAVLYPYTGGRETEQLRRARLLAKSGFATMIEPGDLSPATLAAAVDSAARLERPDMKIDLEGASQSAAIIGHFYNRQDR